MSLADDLRGKLDEATGRLAHLGKRLDEIESLEDSLRQANGGLAQASSDISALARIHRRRALGTALEEARGCPMNLG